MKSGDRDFAIPALTSRNEPFDYGAIFAVIVEATAGWICWP